MSADCPPWREFWIVYIRSTATTKHFKEPTTSLKVQKHWYGTSLRTTCSGWTKCHWIEIIWFIQKTTFEFVNIIKNSSLLDKCYRSYILFLLALLLPLAISLLHLPSDSPFSNHSYVLFLLALLLLLLLAPFSFEK